MSTFFLGSTVNVINFQADGAEDDYGRGSGGYGARSNSSTSKLKNCICSLATCLNYIDFWKVVYESFVTVKHY